MDALRSSRDRRAIRGGRIRRRTVTRGLGPDGDQRRVLGAIRAKTKEHLKAGQAIAFSLDGWIGEGRCRLWSCTERDRLVRPRLQRRRGIDTGPADQTTPPYRGVQTPELTANAVAADAMRSRAGTTPEHKGSARCQKVPEGREPKTAVVRKDRDHRRVLERIRSLGGNVAAGVVEARAVGRLGERKIADSSPAS